MTGLHTGHALIRNNGRGKLNLNDEIVTIAEKLKEVSISLETISPDGQASLFRVMVGGFGDAPRLLSYRGNRC